MHSLKHESPIEVTDDGIIIFSKEAHPLKVDFPTDNTEEGCSNVTSVNDEHKLNVRSSIFSICFGIIIFFNEEHCSNAHSPIAFTEEGI